MAAIKDRVPEWRNVLWGVHAKTKDGLSSVRIAGHDLFTVAALGGLVETVDAVDFFVSACGWPLSPSLATRVCLNPGRAEQTIPILDYFCAKGINLNPKPEQVGFLETPDGARRPLMVTPLRALALVGLSDAFDGCPENEIGGDEDVVKSLRYLVERCGVPMSFTDAAWIFEILADFEIHRSSTFEVKRALAERRISVVECVREHLPLGV